MAKIPEVTDDSRKVTPGMIFVAIKGQTSDGHDFIADAIKNGASIVYGERDLKIPNYVKVTDSRQKLGELASEFFGNPSHQLKIIGVTGTKGKTTTAHLIHHILLQSGKKTGLISSITSHGFHVTSPDVISLHKSLKEMVDAGNKYAVIEVSSHGIDQKRIAGVNFEIGVLTNIAPEHLDYHKTFAEYKRVKMSFINSCKHKVIAPKDTNLDILPGKFNNLNAEAAIKTAEILGIDKVKAIEAIKTFKLPKGRLEEIENGEGFRIFIDFAHTPDSLEAALTYFRTLTKGKLIAVFGCAGERDTKKRRKMGKISGELANLSVFTAEDPRSENITDIFRQMKKEAKNFICIPERGEAIAYALSTAKSGDVVAILGKGHEQSLAYKGFEHPWSDESEVKNFLARDKNISAIILAAGKGSRMKSVKPKILHEIAGRPMISYSLQNLRRAKVGEIIAVVSYRKNLVIREIGGAVRIAVQKNPKGGTADAVSAGVPSVSKDTENIIVLYGDDTAFYTPETIGNVLKKHFDSDAKLTFVTLVKEDPHGLGRILRNEKDQVVGIVEEKEATDNQRKVNEVNDGLYIFDKNWLTKNLPNVEKSPITHEYYIPELIKMAIDQGEKVIAYKLPSDSEWQGINTPEELEKAERKMEEKLK